MTILLCLPSQHSWLNYLRRFFWVLFYVAWGGQFLLDDLFALHQVLFNITSGSIMILALFTQVHQHLAIVCVCICSCIESLIRRWVLAHTLVHWTVDSRALSLGVGLELSLRFGNQRLIKLLSVLSCHSVLNHTFSLIWYRMRLWLPTTIFLYRSGQGDSSIVDRPI